MASGITQANAGATFTSEDVRSTVIQPLRARSVVLQAINESNVFSSNGDPLRLPKISSTPVTDPWRAENTQIAEVDPGLSEVVLLPSSLKSLKVIHRVSNELVRHSIESDNIGNVLGTAFIRKLSLVLDLAMLLGDGSSNTIKGMANFTNAQQVPSVGSLANTAGIDKLHDAFLLALAANADEQGLAWFMNPRELITLRKAKASGSGDYVFNANPQEGLRPTLFGRPVYFTTQMPVNQGTSPANKSTIVLADMSQVAVGIDDDMSVTLLTERYADYDQTGIRVTGRFDIAGLNEEAVVVMSGVQP